jgi:hypothetical protein
MRPSVVVHVLLVERPADALDDPALHLTFHVGGVDRPSGVLGGGVADHLDDPGLRIDLDVADLGRERHPDTAGGERGVARWDRRSCPTCRRDLRDGERRTVTRPHLRPAVDPLDGVDVRHPTSRRPGPECRRRCPGRLRPRPCRWRT